MANIEAALQRRPEDPNLHFFHARAWAECGETDAASAALEQVERHGSGFLPVRDVGFARVWDDPTFRARREAMERALPRVGDSAVEAYRLRRRDLIPEGIAWDATTRRLLIGGLATGEVIAVDADGTQRRFAGPFEGLGQVLGIAVDGGRRRVYAVATNALVPREGVEPTNAVVELDADSGAVRRRLDAAGAGQLNDVAIAADGTVFASDSATGAIWRAAPGDAALQRWPADAALPGANGLAVSARGDALYVAHATGIARIVLASGAVDPPRLVNDTRETVAVIDGLYSRGDTLIGVQNFNNPGRVVEIALDAAGTRVSAVRTLLSHHHQALDEPTTGAVDGDRFLLLAATGIRRLQPDGTIEDAATVPEPVVLTLPLAPQPPSANGTSAPN